MAASNYFCLGLVLMLIAVCYQYRNDLARLMQQYTSSSSDAEGQDSAKPRKVSNKEYYNPPFDIDNPQKLFAKSGTRLFTKNELAAHSCDGPLRPVMLAVLGRVYDVDKGVDYYGPKGGYNFFTGIDGTRAFVTGEFNEEGLIEDIDDFSPHQAQEIDRWVKFYDKDYRFVGKLIGR